MPDTLSGGIITALAAIIVGYLSYRGIRFQAQASRQANRDTVTVNEQETAVKALESMTLNLLEPYRQEVVVLRKRVESSERDAARQIREAEEDRRNRERLVQQQMDKLTERIDLLTIELGHWKRLAKVIARWATTLRDQVLSLGGDVPATPNELLLIQSIDDDDL